jgi:hypothetical protein
VREFLLAGVAVYLIGGDPKALRYFLGKHRVFERKDTL